MKTIKGKQTKIVVGTNGLDFENKLNSVLNDLNNQGVDYELRFNDSQGFCAYVIYEKRIEIPETLSEEYWVVGEIHYCTECKYMGKITDKRVKHARCEYNGRLTRNDSCVCEAFYKALEEAENFFIA